MIISYERIYDFKKFLVRGDRLFSGIGSHKIDDKFIKSKNLGIVL